MTTTPSTGIHQHSLMNQGGPYPSQFPDCKFWFRADMGITTSAGKVTAWADQSGSGNHLAQAAAASRPVYFPSGGVNGQAYVDFDGAADFLENSSIVAGADESYTVLAVAKWDDLTSDCLLDISDIAATNRVINLFANGGNVTFRARNGGDASYAGNLGTNLYTGVHRNALRAIGENGVVKDVDTTTKATFAADRFRLGQQNDGGKPMDGRIYEIMCFAPELDTANMDLFIAKLIARYGL